MSDSESSVSDDENWGEDAERQEEVALAASPLLSPFLQLPSVEEACAHDLALYEFDLQATAAQRSLDFYGVVRLVNWLRREVGRLAPTAEAPLSAEAVRALVVESAGLDADDDSLLKPADQGDPFLHCLDRFAIDDDDDDDDESDLSGDEVGSGLAAVPPPDQQLRDEVRRLREQLAATQNQLALATAHLTANASNPAPPTTAAAADDAPGDAPAASEAPGENETEGAEVDDAYYFTSYSNVYIHETMLRDAARTGAYQRAIAVGSASVFKGAVVIDVGCGTGILSIFAAQAGAAKVIGVDCNSLDTARLAVAANGLGSKVTLVQGKIEALTRAELGLGPEEGVDVIVSEWMGYGLLFEDMLPSVLHARDLFLKPGGAMYPSAASLFLAGWSDKEGAAAAPGALRLSWWKGVHGVDMSAFAPLLLASAQVEHVPASQVVTSVAKVWGADLATVTARELDFTAPFECAMAAAGPLDGFVVSFDVSFEGPEGSVLLDTQPGRPPTHWKQTVLMLDPRSAPGALEMGAVITGVFAMTRSPENPRDYDLALKWAVQGGTSGEQSWTLAAH